MNLRRNDGFWRCQSIFLRFSDPSRACEHYSLSARRKPKHSVAPCCSRSPGTLFHPTNQRVGFKREGGGAQITGKTETKQFSKKGSLLMSPGYTLFFSFPHLISTWLMIESFTLSDEAPLVKMIVLSFFFSNHQVAFWLDSGIYRWLCGRYFFIIYVFSHLCTN